MITDAAGTIISGHFDKKIRIWDPSADKCRTELKFDAAITSLSYNNGKTAPAFFPEIRNLIFLSDNQQLLACLKDDTLKLIDLRQNKTLCTFRYEYIRKLNQSKKMLIIIFILVMTILK